MRICLTALAFLLLLAGEAVALPGIIKGKVYDKNTGEPLAGVYIIYGREQGVITEADGTYIIQNVSGKLDITFQSVGYLSVTRHIAIESDQTTELIVGLETIVREIDQVVVSASRSEQKISELSVSMSIIKAGLLSENHITSAEEIITKTPGIEVLDGQASIRGGSGYSYGAGSRVLALIDGLPVVSADAGNIKWQFLPLENLSQIEIIKGASSVLYGSSALNGVINFRTADASNIPVTRSFIEAGIYGKPRNKDWIWWDTPRIFSGTSFSHTRRAGKTDIGVSAGLLTDEGYRRLNGEKTIRAGLKIKHFHKRISGLSYGVNLNTGYDVKRDFILWEDADSGALKQSPSTAVEYHGTSVTADPFLSYKQSNVIRHDIRIRLQTNLNRLPESVQNNSDAVNLYGECQGWFRLFRFMDLTAGLTENYSVVNSNFFGDHKSFNFAGYSQFDIKLLPTLKAVAGVRFEYNALDDLSDRIVPLFRAGINWQAAGYTFIRASFGQGYRFPSMAEKFAATTLGSVIIIPNPGLLSESGWNSELGIKQGLAFRNITGQADLSLFYMRSNNLIEFMFASHPQGFGFQATNREDSRIYGTEAELILSGNIGKFQNSFSLGYTFMYPVEVNPYTNKNTGTYLKYRRMHSFKTSLATNWKKFDLGLSFYIKSRILNIDYVFINPLLDPPVLEGFAGYWENHHTGYFLMDGTIGYKVNRVFKLSLAVRNITNTEYLGRPGDIQPQRNYSIRLSAEF